MISLARIVIKDRSEARFDAACHCDCIPVKVAMHEVSEHCINAIDRINNHKMIRILILLFCILRFNGSLKRYKSFCIEMSVLMLY